MIGVVCQMVNRSKTRNQKAGFRACLFLMEVIGLVQLSAYATDKLANQARYDKPGQDKRDRTGNRWPIPCLYFRSRALINQAIDHRGKRTGGEKRRSAAIARDKGAE